MAQKDNSLTQTGLIQIDKKLRKSEILSTRKEFNAVLKDGRVVSSQSLSVYFTNGPNRRIAFLVPRDVARNAVVRNRLKRYLREIYRNHKSEFADNYWYIVKARAPAINKSLNELKSELIELVKKVDNTNTKECNGVRNIDNDKHIQEECQKVL